MQSLKPTYIANFLKFAKRKNMKFLTLVCLSLVCSTSLATPLGDFKAVFDVDAFGFTVGKAKQSFSCSGELKKNCTLTSIAKPPSWAERFINESSIEKVTIQQTANQFNWVNYQKDLTRRYDDRTEHKTITLQKNIKSKRITFIEKQKHWPIQEKIFDEISIVYAIQHAILNKMPLNNFYLQGDKIQQKLSIQIKSRSKIIDLPIEEYVKTTLVIFKNANIHAKIWLINDKQYFPGRIEIENKETNKTITLELTKLK